MGTSACTICLKQRCTGAVLHELTALLLALLVPLPGLCCRGSAGCHRAAQFFRDCGSPHKELQWKPHGLEVSAGHAAPPCGSHLQLTCFALHPSACCPNTDSAKQSCLVAYQCCAAFSLPCKFPCGKLLSIQ